MPISVNLHANAPFIKITIKTIYFFFSQTFQHLYSAFTRRFKALYVADGKCSAQSFWVS